MSISGCASWRTFTPSGAATRQQNLIDSGCAPRFNNASIAATADPPVANIGSTTNNCLSEISEGNFTKYSTGCNVSWSRYIPTCPILAAGINSKIPSTIPKPARKIGIMATFLPAKVFNVVFTNGVSISTSSNGKSLETSYAINIEISFTTSRKTFVPQSFCRIIVNLCWINGWSNTLNLPILFAPSTIYFHYLLFYKKMNQNTSI